MPHLTIIVTNIARKGKGGGDRIKVTNKYGKAGKRGGIRNNWRSRGEVKSGCPMLLSEFWGLLPTMLLPCEGL